MKRLLLLLSFTGAVAAPAQTLVQNVTYSSTVTVLGPNSIDANTAVVVASGANVTFQAPLSIRLGPGFTAASGSTFHAVLGAGSPNAPVITSPAGASGTAGTIFRYTINATNSPTAFSASGLPGSLSINTTTGRITGTPTGPGTFSVYLTAANASGTGTLTLSLSILSPAVDSDGDGISDAMEAILGTNVSTPTTDNPAINVNVHRPN